MFFGFVLVFAVFNGLTFCSKLGGFPWFFWVDISGPNIFFPAIISQSFPHFPVIRFEWFCFAFQRWCSSIWISVTNMFYPRLSVSHSFICVTYGFRDQRVRVTFNARFYNGDKCYAALNGIMHSYAQAFSKQRICAFQIRLLYWFRTAQTL